jgi:lipid II:glycine glycyltransferase (peptidoglycan interpeptide bridge formation enzyme)
MEIRKATDQTAWDGFLSAQKYSPFMQSWTMGEVYRDIGEQPIRLETVEDGNITSICQALVVDARRGRHLVVPYGPITTNRSLITPLMDALQYEAKEHQCCFIRLSPFWEAGTGTIPGSKPAPHHLLAEHIWYIDLAQTSEEEILRNMRKNTRNLIRRASKDGVTITRSKDPLKDLDTFIKLHEETRKRHSFTPYTTDFFRAQVSRFTKREECTMYKAHYKDEVIASSIHMHAFGETSYHHGASTLAHRKIPASYLLQWTAIQDALKRKDHMYSFWGIAPEGVRKHPFAGVTLFKRGFGGQLLELTHCMDVPVNSRYYLTRSFETLRKWRRGF